MKKEVLKWTPLAKMCFERKCNCKDCYYDTFFESSQQCRMYKTVAKLTGNKDFDKQEQDHCAPKLFTYLTNNNIIIFQSSSIPDFIGSYKAIRAEINELLAKGHITKCRKGTRTLYKVNIKNISVRKHG